MQSSKIAIIEDDIPIAAMYDFKLKHAGFNVKMAHNGLDGLLLTKEFLPDIILLDLKMPHMGGAEMLEHMRTTTWGSGIRVVILTNISKDEAPQSLRFLNVDRYVVKAHHTPKQVVDVVHEVLAHKR